MILGVIGADNRKSSGLDFSFVKDEVYNLKDVPREFNEDLYLRSDVSRTVIDYWRQIGYNPSYYYQFWLFYDKCRNFNFEEYRRIRDDLISGVCQENEKIGNALKAFALNEDQVYDDYITSDGRHMYYLTYEYDDESGADLMASVYYDKIIDRMNRDIEENKDSSLQAEYYINKYPILMAEEDNRVIGIDVESCGMFYFDKEGVQMYMSCMRDFQYGGMAALYLLDPYIFIPHPFKVGDIVKCITNNEDIYGVLTYAADRDKRDKKGSAFQGDRSEFTATVKTVYESENGDGYEFDHDHICPLYLDTIGDDEILEEDLRELLVKESEKMKADKDYFWYPEE